MNFDVFISYPHEDKAIADSACAALELEGIRCWIAPRDVAPGTEWAAAIVDALDRCRVMVLIFSSSANQSKQIYREVQRAFDRAVPVVPLRVENVEPEQSLAYYLSSVHWLDALTPPIEQHFKRLGVAVKAFLQDGQPAVGEQKSAEDRQWPGNRQPQPASANRPRFRWLLVAAGAGSVAAVAAMVWLASLVPTSTVPTSTPRPAAAIEGKFQGTMECDKLPWTKAPLQVAVSLSIHAGNATFSRDVYSGDAIRKTGTERGSGRLDADGILQLKTSWVSQTSRFDGTYIGRMAPTGGSLAGKQILLVDGNRHERSCSMTVQKVGDA